MSRKEKENLLRIYMLLVDNTKEVLQELLKFHLANLNISFEDFINKHQHDIFHFATREKCCFPSCTSPNRQKIVLRSTQMEVLFDKTSTQAYHIHRSRAGAFCCCKAKAGLDVDVLDITLINFILINFCNDIFWNCCLANSLAVRDFLENNKHVIYHMTHGTSVSCLCGLNCRSVIQSNLNSSDWFTMFSTQSGLACKTLTAGVTHICSVTAPPNPVLSAKCVESLLIKLCPTRGALDSLVKIRNQFCHTSESFLPDPEYEMQKSYIDSLIMTLAKCCGKEDYVKHQLQDFTRRSLDVSLVNDYHNMMMKESLRWDRVTEVITDGFNVTNGRLTRLEDQLESIFVLVETQCTEHFLFDSIIDDENNTTYNFDSEIDSLGFATYDDVGENVTAAVNILTIIQPLQPTLSAITETAKSLYNIYQNRNIKSELLDFIEKRMENEIKEECSGLIQYFVNAIIILNGVGFKKLQKRDVHFIYSKIDPLHGIEFLGKLWQKIEFLKNSSVKRRNFPKLMIFVKSYMYLSFLRDTTFVLFSKILHINGSLNILRGIHTLMLYHQNRDRILLNFFVKPSKETVIFSLMYKPNEWPMLETMLTGYFFQGEALAHKTKHFDEGRFIIKSVKFTDSPLYFSNIGGTWVRWCNTEDYQSYVRFQIHEIDGKMYYEIVSDKWPDYHASMGYAKWWVRGCTGEKDNYSLWQIVPIGDETYVLSSKDSRADLMTTDFHGRVYGTRCIPTDYELFLIENTFEDAFDELPRSDTGEEYRDLDDVSQSTDEK